MVSAFLTARQFAYLALSGVGREPVLSPFAPPLRTVLSEAKAQVKLRGGADPLPERAG